MAAVYVEGSGRGGVVRGCDAGNSPDSPFCRPESLRERFDGLVQSVVSGIADHIESNGRLLRELVAEVRPFGTLHALCLASLGLPAMHTCVFACHHGRCLASHHPLERPGCWIGW